MRTWLVFIGVVILCLCAAFGFPLKQTNTLVGAQQQQQQPIHDIPNIAPGSAYRQTNLISDAPGLAPVLDPLLVNPWGISSSSGSPFWVANAGTSTTQLIRDPNGAGPVVLNANPQTVNIPGGLPTGTVNNSTSEFKITPPGGGTPAVANFIFDSITGNITAWNNASGAAAQNVVSMPGHVWTGLGIGVSTTPAGNRLYAADFENNHIDVFDGTFTATTVTGGFIDATIPADFHPHNIQNLGGSLYVTYAKYDPTVPVTHRAAGVGLGLVRKFNTDGVRDLTFAINDISTNPSSQLNAPWGLAIAPASFGIFGGALLVGNFGEGNPSIHAYNPSTGAFLGTLQNEDGDGIKIDELWALRFGNGGNGGDVNTLYFTAGIGEEEHGLFGKLNPTTATATSLVEFATDNFSVDESGKFVDFTVIRTGDTSGTATVNYNTFDESEPGHASQKSDYEIALGTLTFAPGETSKTFRIFIVDDKDFSPFPSGNEGDEIIDVMLSNPTGAGVGLGSPNTAHVNILDNDTIAPSFNPIDEPNFFVRQHYLDFQNREPDAGQLNSFTSLFAVCGGDDACIQTQRRAISTSFFLSNEFNGIGYLAYLTYRAAYGPNASGSAAPVLYGNFERDLQTIQRGFTFGAPGADAVLEANKVAYFNQFVTRPEFVAKYPATLTNDQFVDNLLITANLSPSDFTVNITNSQEVPPTNPTTTGGVRRRSSYGTAHFTINGAGTAMTMTSTVNNIDFTGSQTADTNDNITNAHIHAGAAVAPGVNGPVVWGFIGTPFNDNNPNDAVVTPFGSGVGANVSGKWDAPEGNGTTLGAQLDNIRNGRAYVNFHTNQFTGGEIRGNFPATQTFRDSLVAALNGATMTRAQVLRAIAENQFLNSREFNAAVVAMAYFGYDRRDPDTSGFNFVLDRINSFGGDFQRANVINLFMKSPEYRQRFGTDPAIVATTNNAPIAVNDSASTNPNTPVVINVTANDRDPEGDYVTVQSVTPGTGGTPTISADGRSITFTPAPGFGGNASFQYTITDNGYNCPAGAGCGPYSGLTENPKTSTATVTVAVGTGGTFQFSAASASVSEGAGKVTLTVTFTGGISTPVTVQYSSADGTASERSDYNTASGVLTFNQGETSKTFDVFITNDVFVESNETFTVTLSNPTGGAGFTLGSPATETVTINDNDAGSAPNPIDDIPFFVRQLYVDFLAREPDTTGFNNYVTMLTGCPGGGFGLSHPECDRVRATITFFNSPEFGERAYEVYRYYDAALGRLPQYSEFIRDLRRIGGALSPADSEAAKVALFNDYVASAEFQGIYGGLTDSAHASQFVAKLEQTAGVTSPEPFRTNLINQMSSGTLTAAQTLRQFIEQSVVFNKFYNRGFASMMYFALLRRNPDPVGFANYVNKLNSTGDQRSVAFDFIYSGEYRSRFGTN